MIDLPVGMVWPTPTLGVAIVQGDERPTDPVGGTCDWGDCQFWAITRRWDESHGWLPVCERHADRIGRRPPQAWAQYDKPCEYLRACAAGDPEVRCVCTMPGEPSQVWTVRWYPNPPRWDRCPQERHSARATIQVVPVVGPHFQRTEVRRYVVVSGRKVVLHDMGRREPFEMRDLPLDPLPQPGRDFAVIVRLTDD